jgi:hypothetical protein
MNKTKEDAKQNGATPIFGFTSLLGQRVFSQIPFERYNPIEVVETRHPSLGKCGNACVGRYRYFW